MRSRPRATSSAGRARRSRCRLRCWRRGGRPARAALETRQAWEQRTARLERVSVRSLAIRSTPDARRALAEAVAEIKAEFASAPPKIATRVASQKVLEKLVPALPFLIGGSADLTGSNGTRIKQHTTVDPGQLRRQLHPLRRARARHGRGHERHGAARRHRPLRRHLPGLHRLLPPGHPPVGADGPAGHLRHDARLHRARRGRADAPARRAPGEPARHAEPQRLPPRRSDRDGGVLGAGAGCGQHALHPGADAAGRAGTANRSEAARTARPKAPTCWPRPTVAAATSPSSPPVRRWASPWRRAAAQPRTAYELRWCRCRAGSCSPRNPLPIATRCSAAPPASRSRPPSASAGSAGWAERRIRGHGRLRRLGAGGQAVRAFRHHPGQGCRSRPQVLSKPGK